MGRYLFLGVAACVFCSSPANADFINGSFETPVVANGGFSDFSVGSTAITGWTVIGPAGTNVSILSGSFSQAGVTFQAADGAQWLDLTGDGSNSTEGIRQAVTTTAGHTYQLSYFIGNTTGGGIFGTTSTVNVSINAVPTFSNTNSAVNPTSLTWQQFTHTFVATGTSTTLDFINGDGPSDNSNGLDAVVLTDLGVVASAPEPTSLTLLASGLVFAAFTRKKRWKIGR